MTETSDDFLLKYFTEGLGNRSNTLNSKKQVDMLNLIRAGICSPMSFLYDNYCAKSVGGDSQTYGAMIYDSIDAGTNTFVSYWGSQINAKITMWERIKNNYGTSRGGW